ncbi:acyltransferase [Nesterenkonia sp. AN1]|uniref:Peptidoglycan/LPS O-acetylase OafA/YrhL n=1 Tax=Nesterenkonia aurantiaca TaxID=1436010 RepID=A0A4R7G479_9MICC|nr:MULTISPECIES: acyltransferase family protein [Nesterenkonia]EXF24444.1 acyltransferase [Nesterenkonia sp. AN1]TDS86071.1 peptidoglycan/LPS O-acetylase OafA/YrhL [Nesterenkonia aurantiaca]
MTSIPSTTATPSGRPLPAQVKTPAHFQPEIQGLRALAVLVVLLYHFWPDRLTGGYVGVDVFFVISGYLITAHLFKEAVKTGGVRLGQFWARRIRRLLPLSLLVLLLTAISAVLILPSTAWQATLRQIIASTLYVQNWVLAADAVEYSKADERATAVQHFWTLSVEEQFYVLWPVLLALTLMFLAFRQRRSGAPALGHAQIRVAFLWVVGLLGAFSLIFSIYYTAAAPAQAYFVTPTRIWEFTLGAIAALVLGSRQFTGKWGNVLGWVGFLMILGSAIMYTDATPFPGWTALVPTLGTVLVLSCGGREPVTGIHWWLSLRPATAIGDWSYAIYLWHWPVVIFSPYISEAARFWYVKVLLILGIIALSALSTRFFETPIRRAKILLPTWRTMVAAGAGMALVIVSGIAAVSTMQTSSEDSTITADHPCYGYRALANIGECGDAFAGELGLWPSPAVVAEQYQEGAFPGCQADNEDPAVQECWLGAEESDADGTIAVFGDSHATMWLPALDEIAQEQDKQLLVLTRSACTPRGGEVGDDSSECLQANAEIMEQVSEDESVHTVVVAASQMHGEFGGPSRDLGLDESDYDLDDSALAMYEPIVTWLEAEKEVVVFGESPRMSNDEDSEETLPECVALNEDDPSACNETREDTQVGDRWLTRSAEVFEDAENYHFVPTEDLVCLEDTCYATIGGAITYSDNSHLAEDFVRSMIPEISDRMEPALSAQG